MSNLEYAKILFDKGLSDLKALKKLYSDKEISDEIKGFHAQQAAEKMLKSILAFKEIEFPFTHRLADLLDLLKDNQVSYPASFENLRFLTPFAVEYRYDYFDYEEEPTNFEEIIESLNELCKWVKNIIFS